MTDEARELDNIKKANKLGVWNKGLQKGLKTYVKETYEEDLALMKILQETEKEIRSKNSTITDENFQQYMDDHLEELERDTIINEEVDDISRFRGDDDTGDIEAWGEDDDDYMY